MVTILQALQEANTAAGIKNLSFANLQEFNAFKDGFNFLDYPQNVVVPIDISGQVIAPKHKETLLLQGWVLTRIREDTNDWRSVKLEPDYIEPMRILARNFIRRLVDTDIIDPEVGPVNYRIKSEYMFLSAHLFGVSYSANIPLSAYVC